MAHGIEAVRHAQLVTARAVNLQGEEHNRWEKTDRFDWDILAEEPSRHFWWMLQQPRYMNHIYRIATEHRGSGQEFPRGLQDAVMRNYSGAVNEILAYFTHAAAIRVEDEGLILLDQENSRKLILADADFARRRNLRYAQPIAGRLIGNYSPDGLMATLSDNEVVAAFEATLVNGASVHPTDYQQEKVKNLEIAQQHHPHIFGSDMYIQLGIPESNRPIRRFEPEVEPVDLMYSTDDLHQFMSRFFYRYSPGNTGKTLAEIMPELREHPTLRGELPERGRERVRQPQRRPAYT